MPTTATINKAEDARGCSDVGIGARFILCQTIEIGTWFCGGPSQREAGEWGAGAGAASSAEIASVIARAISLCSTSTSWRSHS